MNYKEKLTLTKSWGQVVFAAWLDLEAVSAGLAASSP